jgi:hypothetical protein
VRVRAPLHTDGRPAGACGWPSARSFARGRRRDRRIASARSPPAGGARHCRRPAGSGRTGPRDVGPTSPSTRRDRGTLAGSHDSGAEPAPSRRPPLARAAQLGAAGQGATTGSSENTLGSR